MIGTLTLCATPIGNLEDITLRVLRCLRESDLIAAEDTRHTLGLLNHYGITTPLTSYHQHNKVSKGIKLLEKLREGMHIALVTDAGMPGISDPGMELARSCQEEGIPVTVAPGPSAGITALALSGMDSRRFVFEGFLPTVKKERQTVLARLKEETRTVIFYEAPHRLKETLEALLQAAGDRHAALVRELTKKHEQYVYLSLSALRKDLQERPARGEYVILLEGREEKELLQEQQKKCQEIPLREHMNRYLSQGLDEKSAMKQVAKDRGVSKRDVYQWLLQEGEGS